MSTQKQVQVQKTNPETRLKEYQKYIATKIGAEITQKMVVKARTKTIAPFVAQVRKIAQELEQLKERVIAGEITVDYAKKRTNELIPRLNELKDTISKLSEPFRAPFQQARAVENQATEVLTKMLSEDGVAIPTAQALGITIPEVKAPQTESKENKSNK